MRALLVVFALATPACTTDLPPPDPVAASVRARLTAGEARLWLAGATSGGTLAAYRRVAGDDWQGGATTLVVEQSELALTAEVDGELMIERFSLTLAPITIPAAVFGHEVVLTDVRAELAGPTRAATIWAGDDAAAATAELDLAFTWALRVDGNTAPLGAPTFPPLAVELAVAGGGEAVQATVRAARSGELWRWADLVRFEDLALTVAVATR